MGGGSWKQCGIKGSTTLAVETVVNDFIKGFKTLSLMLGPDISPNTCKCRPSSPMGIFARIV